jgi:hypothetical protein
VRIDPQFLKHVLLALGILAAMSVYPLLVNGSREILIAAGIGALMGTANVVAGYLAIEYSINKSHTTFLKAVLGGMGVRMVAMLGLLVVLLKVFEVHAVALTVSLLTCYVVFLAIEIFFIQKKLLIKNQN